MATTGAKNPGTSGSTRGTWCGFCQCTIMTDNNSFPHHLATAHPVCHLCSGTMRFKNQHALGFHLQACHNTSGRSSQPAQDTTTPAVRQSRARRRGGKQIQPAQEHRSRMGSFVHYPEGQYPHSQHKPVVVGAATRALVNKEEYDEGDGNNDNSTSGSDDDDDDDDDDTGDDSDDSDDSGEGDGDDGPSHHDGNHKPPSNPNFPFYSGISTSVLAANHDILTFYLNHLSLQQQPQLPQMPASGPPHNVPPGPKAKPSKAGRRASRKYSCTDCHRNFRSQGGLTMHVLHVHKLYIGKKTRKKGKKKGMVASEGSVCTDGHWIKLETATKWQLKKGRKKHWKKKKMTPEALRKKAEKSERKAERKRLRKAEQKARKAAKSLMMSTAAAAATTVVPAVEDDVVATSWDDAVVATTLDGAVVETSWDDAGVTVSWADAVVAETSWDDAVVGTR